ncbi:DUF805 domain-containing protein [Phaeocystidibacter luteus]|uniref:DUF805 domain-containing protein n=1 Tax=Phaeocystidibacter luteus TaxID=911197 RepID=A0A6N6RMF6_9FLAO|nr:DUF805 domain-containing protein [Phaeocystidibacter luteus]KAB2814753.1 DUF805 domain-containing protein [Phaeocystidibacter luteus]
MNVYVRIMTRYAEFDGRLRRRDYWIFVLITFAIMLVTSLLGNLFLNERQAMIPLALVALVHFIPLIAVDIRRLHDQGKSGAWWFIRFIPLIGGIWFLVLMLTEGDTGRNEYGPDPKALDNSFAMSDENILDNKF